MAHVQVLEEAECKQLGMGLFLGVAQGSEEPLRFIHLTYTPEGPIRRKV
jgi:leucyl aminopeptidase